MKGSAVVSVVIFLLIESTSGLKCNSIVKIESSEILSYLGNVSFHAPGDSDGIWSLYMKTSTPFTFIGGWGVRVDSHPELNQAIFQSDESTQIQSGDEISFRFRMHYGEGAVTPKVRNIQWQKWNLCDGISNADSDTLGIFNGNNFQRQQQGNQFQRKRQRNNNNI